MAKEKTVHINTQKTENGSKFNNKLINSYHSTIISGLSIKL